MSTAPLVLVADDEPSMLELVARHLRTMQEPKLEVIQASDGDEALRLARQHLPDLVVLDVMMPGMSGWEVCRKIREDLLLVHTGIVMLTGIGENLNQLTSPLYGADAYIDKPFEFQDFDTKVRATLRARESQREGVERTPINGTSGAARSAPRATPTSKARHKKSGAKVAAKKAVKATPAKKNPVKRATKKTAKKLASSPKKKTLSKTAKKVAPKMAKKVAAKKTTAAKTVRGGAKKARRG